MISQHNVLSWATFFPLVGLAVILILVAARYFLGLSRQALDQSARVTGITASGLSFLCSILAWAWFDPSVPGIQLKQHFTWIKTFNIEYLMGVDGLSISMVLLTGLISFVAFIAAVVWREQNGRNRAQRCAIIAPVDMTQVYLIRHAQQFSAHNDQGLLLADHEDGLTEKGHAQARRMAERVVNDIQPEVLYCSPLLRARQTARALSEWRRWSDSRGRPPGIIPPISCLGRRRSSPSGFVCWTGSWSGLNSFKDRRHSRRRCGRTLYTSSSIAAPATTSSMTT